MWRVGRERVLLAGGPAALLLQIAHPLVAAAVDGHSDFRRDPFKRLRATLDATLRISFGDSEQARSAADSVAATHRRVHGRLPVSVGDFAAGTRYDALDPTLALWVHATLVWIAIDAYDVLVRPLAQSERAAYYKETKLFARQFGVTDELIPSTYNDFLSFRASMLEGSALQVGDQAKALAAGILHPPVPAFFALSALPLNVLTAKLLPPELRAEFGLPWRRRERLAFHAIAHCAPAAVRALPPRIRYWPHYRTAARRMHGVLSASIRGGIASERWPAEAAE